MRQIQTIDTVWICLNYEDLIINDVVDVTEQCD